MILAEVATSRHWTAAGLTMLHYFWIGALLGVFAALVRSAVRPHSPVSRYVASIVCLGIQAIAPMLIYFWVLGPDVTIDIPAAQLSASRKASANTSSEDVFASSLSSLQEREIDPGHTRVAAAWNFTITQSGHILPWIWLSGSSLMLAIVLTGVQGSRRLCLETRSLSGTPIDLQCRRIAQSLGVGRRVLIVVSDRILAPVVVGIWRPTIILPLSVWTGFEPMQIEMILWHELAHVRRYDNLMNFFERVIQSLLFFQPAIWIVCRWVRLERENCCDAVALSHSSSRHAYAETLASLAVPGLRMPTALASGANHQLVARIRCILHPNEEPVSLLMRIAPRLAALGIAVGCVAAVCAQQDGPSRKFVARDATLKENANATAASVAQMASQRRWSRGRDRNHLADPSNMTGQLLSTKTVLLDGDHSSGRRSIPAAEIDLGPAQVADINRSSQAEFSTKVLQEASDSSRLEFNPPGPREATAAEEIRKLGGWVFRDEQDRVEEVNLAYHDTAEGRIHNETSADSDAGLRQVSAFPHLKRLSLYRGQATDEALRAIAGLKKLETISSWSTKGITDEGVRALAGLTNLREAYFDAGNLGDGALAVFGRLPKLEVLRMLIGNEVTDAGLSGLAGATQLRELAIGQGKFPITDAGIEHLLKLTSLEDLNLQDSKISEQGVAQLKNLPNLRLLRVNSSQVFERAGNQWVQIQ